MVKISRQHNCGQLIKSSIFMFITYIPLFYMTFDIKAEILYNDPVKSTWERLFDVLCNTPVLPMHYWIAFAIMLFLTMGNRSDYNRLIRYQNKKSWIIQEMGNIIGNNILFSFFYSIFLFLITILVFGCPDTTYAVAKAQSSVPLNYSIFFILFSTTVLRIISGIAIGLGVFYLYLSFIPKASAILVGGFYGILSVFILFYGTFLKGEAYKYFIFPSNIAHFFFVSGTPLNNYIAGFALPLVICLLLGIGIFYKFKNTELL